MVGHNRLFPILAGSSLAVSVKGPHWHRTKPGYGEVPTSERNPRAQQHCAHPKKTFPLTPAFFSTLCPLFCISPSTSSSNSSDEESLSEEELAMLMEQVEQKKKLISTMRNKPWRMVKKLSVLRYPSHWESTPGVFADCQMRFAFPRYCMLAAATLTSQSQKK